VIRARSSWVDPWFGSISKASDPWPGSCNHESRSVNLVSRTPGDGATAEISHKVLEVGGTL